MKKTIVSVLIMAAIIAGATVLGVLLMFGVYSLPTWYVQEHVRENWETFAIEVMDPNVYEGFDSKLDLFSDSIMLAEAEYPSQSALEDSMLVKRLMVKEAASSTHSYCLLYEDADREMCEVTYSRYWHGFLVVLKPLLIFFNYLEIRTINLAVQLLLAAALMLILVKKNMKIWIPAFAVLILLQDPNLTSRSLHYSSVNYIYIIGTIFLLLFYEKLSKPDRIPFVFLLLGIATSFFDLLSYPLVTYGIPAVACLALDRDRNAFAGIKKIVIYGLSWIFGYGGMWLGKGIAGSFLVGENLMSDIMEAVMFRVSDSNGVEEFTKAEAIYANIETFAGTLMFPLFLLFCLSALLYLVYRQLKGRGKMNGRMLLSCLPFLVLFASTFCWYYVLANHSMIHYWFSYRALFVSAFALMCMLTRLISDSVALEKAGA